jgi:hypothetical protein
VLSENVMLVRRGHPLGHVRPQPVDERRHRKHALTRPPSTNETSNYLHLNICNIN